MPTGPAFDKVITALEQRGHRVKRHGHYATTWCTHVGADNPSGLSVFDNGSRVKLTCFTAGCDGDTIAESLGMTWRDLYDHPHGEDLATYHYDDRTVHRRPGKQFTQSGVQGPSSTLYQLAAVRAAVARGETIYLVEGEEDVHTLQALGAVGTTAPMGARNFDKADVAPLTGAHVIAIPDRDSEGERWAELVTTALDGVAASLRFAQPAYGKDVSDHAAAGHGLDQLIILDPAADRRAETLGRYPALDLAVLLDPNRPVREYVVGGLIPAGAAVSLAAPAGTGKSLLTLGLALAVSRGRRAFAGLPIPRQRRVLYIDMENTPDDLAERFESFGLRRGDTLGGLTYLSLPALPPLDSRAGADELLAILDAYGLQSGDMVVLDSLQRVIGGEENSADTMRAYYLYTGMRLKKAGLTSLRLDNTGKDVTRGSRGTSGKRDDVDLELVMAPDADDEEKFHVSVNKSRVADISPLTLTRYTDRSGLLTFSTKDDGFRSATNAARDELARRGVPTDATLSQVRDALTGRNFTDRTIRAAAREWRSTPPAVCTTCGLPMTSLGDGATTHPTCEEN